MKIKFKAGFNASWAVSMVVLVAIPCAGIAQNYPTKPVRVVVPYNAGGTTDIVARIVGHKLSQLWSNQVLIDNRVGAGGVIGTELVARAPADGYTLAVVGGSFTITPSLHPNLGYSAVKDFFPITLIASTPNVLMVSPSLPVHSVRDLINLAKRRPGELLYGSGGVGTTSHLATELFNLMAGLKMTHVPYQGESRIAQETMTGQIQVMIASIPANVPKIKAGRLHALAVTGSKRVADLPELPTIAEAGVPGYEMIGWYGALAPANTAQDTTRKLEFDFVRAIRDKETAAKLVAAGADPVASTSEDFAKHIATELANWAKVIQKSGANAN